MAGVAPGVSAALKSREEVNATSDIRRGSGWVATVCAVYDEILHLQDKLIACRAIWVDGGVFTSTSTLLGIDEAAGFNNFTDHQTHASSLSGSTQYNTVYLVAGFISDLKVFFFKLT